MNTKAYRGGIAAMRGTIAPWRCEMTEVKNNWFANVRDMFSGPALALGLMYALSLLSTWLMNVTAYPGFHDYAPWARDVATAAGGVAGVIYALYARWRPYGLLGSAGFWACVSLLAVAPLLMLAGVAWSNALLALVGSCARSATSPFVGVYLVFALMNLTGPQRMGALVVSYAIYFVGLGALEPLASSQASWVQSALEALFVALPLAAVVPLHRKAFPMLCKAGTLGTQSELSPTNPAPFLLLNHRLYVVAALFQAAMGYATTFASSQSYPQPLMPTLGVLVLLAACALLTRGATPMDSLYTLAFGCTLAGFLLTSGTVGGLGSVVTLACGSLCRVGEALFRIALWVALASIGARNLVGALPLVLMVNGIGSFGFEMGALTGHGINYLMDTQSELLFVVEAIVVFVFALSNVMLARTFSFDATVAGVEPVKPVRELSEEAAGARNCDAICARLAVERGLTAREAEVLPLLARGRNVAYIMEELTLSRNTIKSYVARVYGKLDVHSHQELIDLVEHEMEDAGKAEASYSSRKGSLDTRVVF